MYKLVQKKKTGQKNQRQKKKKEIKSAGNIKKKYLKNEDK